MVMRRAIVLAEGGSAQGAAINLFRLSTACGPLDDNPKADTESLAFELSPQFAEFDRGLRNQFTRTRGLPACHAEIAGPDLSIRENRVGGVEAELLCPRLA